MRAIGYQKPGPIGDDASLVDIGLPEPRPVGRDLLVEVKAVSVNPVDFRVRRSTAPVEAGSWKVLGWDASGIVRATGPDSVLFKPGDEVFYAGSITRTGTNAELHCVDERIVGLKPKTLDWAEAAALPLTAITAWEGLFVRLDVRRPVLGAANAILIVGGAGGVGSIAVQIARKLTDLVIIATASRPETRGWVEGLGAHHVIDHTRSLSSQIDALGLGAPGFVFSTTHTGDHFNDIAELISPQGRFGFIDDPSTSDIMAFKRKSVSIHHELMFTRSIYGTPDMGEQGGLLNEVSRLVDQQVLRTTMTKRLAPINASNLKQAHVLLESGTTRGKIVIEGFSSAD